jgi:hypothetical protein
MAVCKTGGSTMTTSRLVPFSLCSSQWKCIRRVVGPLLRYFASGFCHEGASRQRLSRKTCRLQRRMPSVSGLFDTDTMNFIECQKCDQPAGKVCTDHRGKNLSTMHGERAEDYRSKFKDRGVLYKDGPDRMGKVRAYNAKLAKGSRTHRIVLSHRSGDQWAARKVPLLHPGIAAALFSTRPR